MPDFEITRVVLDEHPGWTRTYFTCQSRPWNVLTTVGKDGSARSLLSPKDDIRDQPWPYFHIMALDGIITPDAAATIIIAVYSAYSSGKTAGVVAQRSAVRAVLGL